MIYGVANRWLEDSHVDPFFMELIPIRLETNTRSTTERAQRTVAPPRDRAPRVVQLLRRDGEPTLQVADGERRRYDGAHSLPALEGSRHCPAMNVSVLFSVICPRRLSGRLRWICDLVHGTHRINPFIRSRRAASRERLAEAKPSGRVWLSSVWGSLRIQRL